MEDAESSLIKFDATKLSAATPAELAGKIFAGKARRRSWMASLTVEEKYRRLLQLQRMVWKTRYAAGKPSPAPWPDRTSV
ncbi:MAG: hypothetical protein EXS36_07915 [Pedosphaera sp.]|nr:hypothetical protein [Pedosphaera sp.]